MIEYMILSFALGVAYVGTVLCAFGIPYSLSESFYLLESKRKGLGYVFTGWCWVQAIGVMAMMLHVSQGQWWQFMGLFAGGGLGFVGAAPLFKGHERVIHYASAGVCAVFALAWMAAEGYVVVPVTGLLGLLGLLGLRHTGKWLFWTEMTLFISMYVVLWMKFE
jgi:hypothetical protein